MMEQIFTSPEEKAWVNNFNPTHYDKEYLRRENTNLNLKLQDSRNARKDNEELKK